MSEQSSQPKPNKKTGRFTAPIVVGSLVVGGLAVAHNIDNNSNGRSRSNEAMQSVSEYEIKRGMEINELLERAKSQTESKVRSGEPVEARLGTVTIFRQPIERTTSTRALETTETTLETTDTTFAKRPAYIDQYALITNAIVHKEEGVRGFALVGYDAETGKFKPFFVDGETDVEHVVGTHGLADVVVTGDDYTFSEGEGIKLGGAPLAQLQTFTPESANPRLAFAEAVNEAKILSDNDPFDESKGIVPNAALGVNSKPATSHESGGTAITVPPVYSRL